MALPALLSGLGRQALAQGAKGAVKSALFGGKDKESSGKKAPETKSDGNNKPPSNRRNNYSGVTPSSSIVPLDFTSNITGVSKGGENDLYTIKEKVIKIENLLGDSYKFRKKQAENQRKLDERSKRKMKEDLLEKTPEENKNKGKNNIKIPGKGMFDNLMSRIYNFIFWIAIGKALPTIEKFLPQIIGFVGVLINIMDVIISVVGTILDSIITFVDLGFKAWEQIRGAAKAIGGDGLVDALDKFTGVVDTLLNLLFIASMASMVGDFEGITRGIGRAVKRGTGRALKRVGIQIGGKTGGKIFNRIGDAVGGVGKRIGDAVGGVGKRIGDAVGGVGKRIGDAVGGAAKGAKDFVTKKGSEAIGFITENWKKIKDGAIDLGQKALSTGKSWADNVVKSAGNLKDKAQQEIVDKLIGPLKSQADDLISKSPVLQKVMSLFKGTGKQGFSDAATAALKQFKNFVEPIAKPLGQTLRKLNLPVLDSVIEVLYAGVDLASGVPPVRVALRFGGSLAGLAAGVALTGASAFFSGGFGAFLAPVLIGASQFGGEWLGDRVADIMGIPENVNIPKPTEKKSTEKTDQSKSQDVPAKNRGGIVPIAFETGGLLSPEGSSGGFIKNKELSTIDTSIPKSSSQQSDDKQKYSGIIKSKLKRSNISKVKTVYKDNKNVKDVYQPAGIKKLVDLADNVKDIPIIGSSMYAALNLAIGNKVDSNIVGSIADDLLYFSNMDSFVGASKSLGDLNAMQDGGMITKTISTDQVDIEMSKLSLQQFLSSKINRDTVEQVSESEKKKAEEGNAWWDPLGLFKPKEKPQEPGTTPSEDTPGAPDDVGSISGGGTITSISGMSSNQKGALNVLAKYESGAAGYDAVNQIGTSGGRGVKGFSGDIKKMPQHKGRSLTDFTIAEIKALQRDDKTMSDSQWISAGKLHAVGRYQFVGNTLPGVAKRAGIPDSAKFTPEVQDIMALQLMKERGISPWVGPSDKATPSERAIVESARKEALPKVSVKQGSSTVAKSTPKGSSPKSSPDNTIPKNTIPGGSFDFIGNGDGATGKLTLKDGSGKSVGSWNAISGDPSTAGATQEERKNVSGTANPLPDGNYPLLAFQKHSYMKGIGVWSAYINNSSGSIGRRSQLLLHNDINDNGTLGCVGVRLGGTSDTAAEKKFLEAYSLVQPKSIRVAIGRGSSSGTKPKSSPDNKYQGGGLISPIKNRTYPESFASYEQPGTNTNIIMIPVPVKSSSSQMSYMTSKSLQSIPERMPLNSMGSRMDQIHQLSR